MSNLHIGTKIGTTGTDRLWKAITNGDAGGLYMDCLIGNLPIISKITSEVKKRKRK